MINFHERYRPVTAVPFMRDNTYCEIEPCNALKPYVRCFWGSMAPHRAGGKTAGEADHLPRLVIPDTCMDIIFEISHSENKITGGFCGIDDRPFMSTRGKDTGAVVSMFAIRFYAWTAVLFSEESMCNVRNNYFDAGEYFSKIKKKMEPLFFDVPDMASRISIAENFLLQNLHTGRLNHVVMDAVEGLLNNRGNIGIGELVKEVHVSGRQLERLFGEYIGMPPKQLAKLIRYQYLWQDILYNRDFQILDGVFRYGYTDQPHLLHDFKRYHGMLPAEARKLALSDVAFLQEKSYGTR